MKENLAVIPLKEYRELLEIKEKIASAFELIYFNYLYLN